MHSELAGLSQKELLALARAEGIRGRHLLTRADLVDALVETYRRLMDTPEALRSLTRRDLMLLARAFSVERRHRLRKADLIEALWPKWATSDESAGRPQAVEGANYGPIPSPAGSEPPEALPSGYGSTRLTLMPIDPYRIHAYWEIAPADLEVARQSLGEEAETAATVLRVRDVTGLTFDRTDARHTLDVEVGGAANWYLTLWSAEKSYVADLGLRAPSGHFVSLVRSNVVHTPRPVPSERREERWIEVSWRSRPILRPGRGLAPGREAKAFPVVGAPTAAPADRGAATPEVTPGPPPVRPEKPPGRPAGPREAMGGETEVTREGKGLRAWPVEWLPAVSWQVEAEPADHRGGPGTPPAIGEGIAGFTLRGPRPEAQGEPEGRQGTPGLLGWRDLAGTWTTSPPGGHLLFGKR